MFRTWLCFFVAALSFSGASQSQTLQSNVAPSACPIEILSFDPAGVSARIRNTSDKIIVGLVFNAAIADATEHWKWVHWNFDNGLPLRDFGWNKKIEARATKRLTWVRGADLDFEHIGGGAFVLTSALFDDGSRWEEQNERNSCKRLWFKHKRLAFRPIDLPPREEDRAGPAPLSEKVDGEFSTGQVDESRVAFRPARTVPNGSRATPQE